MQVVFQAPHHFKRNFITAAGYFLSNTQQILNALIYVAPSGSKKRVQADQFCFNSQFMFTLSNKNCLATAIPIFDHLGDAVINTRSSNGIWLVFKLLELQRPDGLPKTCRIMSITWKGETCGSQIQYVSSPTILYHKEYFKTICVSTKLTFMFLMEITAFPKLSNFIFLSQL